MTEAARKCPWQVKGIPAIGKTASTLSYEVLILNGDSKPALVEISFSLPKPTREGSLHVAVRNPSDLESQCHGRSVKSSVGAAGQVWFLMRPVTRNALSCQEEGSLPPERCIKQSIDLLAPIERWKKTSTTYGSAEECEYDLLRRCLDIPEWRAGLSPTDKTMENLVSWDNVSTWPYAQCVGSGDERWGAHSK